MPRRCVAALGERSATADMGDRPGCRHGIAEPGAVVWGRAADAIEGLDASVTRVRRLDQSSKAALHSEGASSAREYQAVGTATTVASPVTLTLPFGAVTSSPFT
jgi:hypothetical protein